MSLSKIVADDFGQVLRITFIDVDTDAAANISAYVTAQQMLLIDPDGNSATKVAAFLTDGSDGIITYTLVDGDIDEAGDWLLRGRVTSAAARLTTELAEFNVLE